MVYYKPVKVTINAPMLAKVILDIVILYYGWPDSIISNKSLLLYICQFIIHAY